MKKQITVVRLCADVFVGRSLDLQKCLVSGETVGGVLINLDFYDDNFMSVQFKGKGQDAYVQLIPWSRVDTVLFKEVK